MGWEGTARKKLWRRQGRWIQMGSESQEKKYWDHLGAESEDEGHRRRRKEIGEGQGAAQLWGLCRRVGGEIWGGSSP